MKESLGPDPSSASRWSPRRRGLGLLLGAFFVLAAFVSAGNAYFDPTPTPSTGPIGSAFYRHLAADYNLDIRDLVKLERRGFGRGEAVTLVLISSTTGVPVKQYAKRRLKDKVLLKDLAAEAKMDYPTLLKKVQTVKEGIEAKGENDLPPPVFEPSPTPQPRRKKDKSKTTPETTPVPAATPQTAVTPQATPVGPPAPTPAPPDKP